MKSIKHIIIVMAIIIANNANATVRTLNNNNPSPGQYTAWIFAQAASSSGDTIYVSGSPLSYGNISVTVFDLTIIGTGHNPQKQFPLVSMFDTISFSVGQIALSGIKASCIYQNNPLGTTHVTIENCLSSISILNAYYDAYYTIRNSILYHSGSMEFLFGGFNNTYSNPSLILDMRNNLVFGSIGSIMAPGGHCTIINSIISNNVFQRCGNASGGSAGLSYNEPFAGGFEINNTLLSNNIFYNYTYFSNSTFSNSTNLNNCIGNGPANFNALPNDNGSTLVEASSFVNGCSSLCGFSYANDFHLLSTSICKNAGTDGTDIGAYGGPYGAGFNDYGSPPIPQIQQMNVPATVVSGNNFTINIISKVK